MVLLIGIAGDSGTGKSRFAQLIKEVFKDVSVLHLDDYHKYDRETRKKLNITPLNPKANKLDLIEEHLRLIKNGKEVIKPVYDHKTGKIIENSEVFKPKDIVIVEGLLPFYNERLSKIYDLKIFIEVDKKLKLLWKIKRDLKERGYKEEFDLKLREKDYNLYVKPQIKKADIVLYVNFLKSYKNLITSIHIRKENLISAIENSCISIGSSKFGIYYNKSTIDLLGRFTKKNFSKIIDYLSDKYGSFDLENEFNSYTGAQILLLKVIDYLWEKQNSK